jgi:predicted transcriptional regulator
VHLFSASVRKADLVGRGLEALAGRLCDGALGPLLTYLVGARPLSLQERAELRKILDEPKSTDAPKKEKR